MTQLEEEKISGPEVAKIAAYMVAEQTGEMLPE